MPEIVREFLLAPATLAALYWTMLALCVVLILGVRPFQPLAILFGVLVLVYDVCLKGYSGLVSHALFALLYTTWILACFPAGDGLSILGPSSKKQPVGSNCYRAPMVLMPFFLSLTYMLIGARRIAFGGVEIFFGDSMPVYIAETTMMYSRYRMEVGYWMISNFWLAQFSKLSLFVSTILEFLSPLSLFSTSFRYVWLVSILVLHFGSLLLLNIYFWENTILLVTFFTGLPYLFSRQSVAAAPAPA